MLYARLTSSHTQRTNRRAPDCGNALINSQAQIADTACNMACTGDSATACGGADALTVFQKGASAGARRSHRARHFGRAHQHSGLF